MEKVDLEALDAMHAAAKSVGFVIEGDDLDTAQCGHYLAALHNAYPALAAELRALREERDPLRAEAARLRRALGRSITALVFADTPESKAFHFGELVAQLREALASTSTTAEWLAARDEQMKRLGAAEWIEANNERLDTMNRSDVEEIAAQLRREAEGK